VRLKLHRTGGHWHAVASDPAAGLVSLRSVGTGARGDRTTQTVSRAYGVS
jgi:hypothetical protein